MLAFVIVLHQTPVCWSEAGFVCSTKCTDGSAWLLWFWHHFYANRQTCQSTANANENQQHLFPTGLSLWEMRTRTPRTFISASLSLWEMRTRRAVRYNHIYRMDEIKSIVSYYVLSFISWCRKIHCFRWYLLIIWVTAIFIRRPPRGVKERQNQPGQNQELVTKRGTTSVACSCVFKHCSFKATDFKP